MLPPFGPGSTWFAAHVAVAMCDSGSARSLHPGGPASRMGRGLPICLEVNMLSHQTNPGQHGPGFFKKALEKAKNAVAEGGILSYEVEKCPTRGRVIKLRTWSGLSPYPMFVEFPR